MKIAVGKVTAAERDEIQAVFERRNGLNELAHILTVNNNMLYERLVKDLAATAARFQGWWTAMAAKYQWESAENGTWEIDFADCTIYLVTPD